MIKPSLIAMLVAPATLATLTACSDPAPTPETTATSTLDAVAAATAPPANTPEPTPTTSPTPATPSTPTPGANSPLPGQGQEALLSSLSEDEIDCIGQDPERMIAALTGGAPASMEEQARLTQCLDDGTVDQLFIATIIPVPLSQATSGCVMAALDVIDPRAVMTAGLEGDPQTAMGGSMAAFTVYVACLNDEEWTTAAPILGMVPEDRDGMMCIMAALGGPAEMATALTEAMEAEDVAEGTALFMAGLECGIEEGLEPGSTPEPATETPEPGPTPEVEPATPTPEPAREASTPESTPTTPGSTPTPEPTREPPTTAPTETNTLVITVAEIPAGIPEYDRDDWKHWTDADGDCKEARQEVLIVESLVPVTFEDDRQCRVESGRWWTPHLGHHLENPRHIDVDHHVPLKNAHLSGGWAWDAERKEAYANYLEDPDHLAAISSRHNRSKGARGPEEWVPPDNSLWCEYAIDWAEIKERWGLTMTPVESEIVMDMLGTCEEPVRFEVESRDVMEVKVGVDKPTGEPEGTVYGSCEEAAAAGEERVQGSQGRGRGFPAAMIPSARDGDGDGIVCEQ